MKNKFLVLLLALAVIVCLAGCGCEHVWTAADCVNPNTCSECGETEGAPLGHTWKAATCVDAKTCEVCGATEGEAMGHSWVEATCEEPKTCSECKLTEGEALGHVWQDATTEAPKTCTTCAATEGERITTDERFTTASTAAVQGKWTGEVNLDGTLMEIENFPGTFVCILDFTFGPDGKMEMGMAVKDEEAFNALMVQYMEDTLYASFADQNISKEDADAAMLSTYGMSVHDYAVAYVDSADMASLFDTMGIEGVYYVQDGKLYTGTSWSATLEGSAFTVEGDTLSIEDFEVGEQTIVLTRVVEE